MFQLLTVQLLSNDVFFLSAFSSYLKSIYKIDIPPNQEWYCRLATTMFIWTASLGSTSFILSMTFDRFYSIIRPHKAASFNTVKRAKITIVFIVIFSLCFNVPFIFTISHQARQCVPDIGGTWKAFYYWLYYVVQFIIPFPSLLSMNSIHVLRIRSKSMISQGHDSNLGQGQDQLQKIKSSENWRSIFSPFCYLWLLVSSSWSLHFMLLICIVCFLTILKLLRDLQIFICFTTLSTRCISLIMV